MTATAPMIISLHVPKCAGSGLRSSLENTFGKSKVLHDYDDAPGNPNSLMHHSLDELMLNTRSASKEISSHRAIHGHFYLPKYDIFPDAFRCTFLRHPLDRAISHYFFWKSLPATKNPLHKKLLENNLSFEAFISQPIISHFYTNVYFKNVDMHCFNLIGSTENYTQDLSKLNEMIDQELIEENTNSNPHKRYDENKAALTSDPKTIARAETILADDIHFYHQWVPR